MTTLEQLKERAAPGLDLSPGDELCAKAATEIESLRKELAEEKYHRKNLADEADRQQLQHENEKAELRRQNAELVEMFILGCIEAVYESREYGTPGKLLCLRCRLCGSECKNHDEMVHDTNCVIYKALADQFEVKP